MFPNLGNNLRTTMNKTKIQDLLQKGERISLECKKASTNVPESLWESYSAFANTYGGTILLGVKEDLAEKDRQKRFAIVGVDDSEKIVKDFWNLVNNAQKVSMNLLKDDDVEVVDVDGKDVVVINVPRARYNERPVFVGSKMTVGNVFKRNHEGDYKCTQSDINAMIRDANEDGNDGILIEYYGMDDVDEQTLREYRQEFRDENADHPWNKCDDKTFLKNLGGYVVERGSDREGLTLAGLLMFGKGLSIRERFSNFRMDYIDFSNCKGEERYRERLTYDGRWENNLYQFFTTVSPKITRDLPRPFKLVGMKREDDTPQHKAVREALTNSIIHSDVFLAGGILRIEKHNDKLCFRNPGTLKLPLEEIYEGGNSKARNPKMQDMLRMIGFGENLGSGFPKILDAWNEAKWNAPTLEDRLTTEEVRLTLPIPFAEFTVETTTQETAETTTQETAEATIQETNRETFTDTIVTTQETTETTTQETILAEIRKNPSTTREQLAEIVGISKEGVKWHLDKMKKLGLIKHVGSTKGGYWKIQ